MKKIIYLVSIISLMGFTFACSKSEDSNPAPGPVGSTPGPKFLAAKSVVSRSCALSGCHIEPSNTGGINFETDNNIVANGAQIKSLAVDLGTMPPTGPLSDADKAIITEWINAGGKLTN